MRKVQGITVRGRTAQLRISLLSVLAVFACALVPRANAGPVPPAMRLYAIDCGRLDYTNMDGFSDTDDYAGQTGSLVVPCFLVRHGDDWMLWDTGVGDRIAALPNGEMKQGGRFSLRRTLASQLAQIGLKAGRYQACRSFASSRRSQREHRAFSHAIFLLSAVELPWARSLPTPDGVEAPLIVPLDHAQVDSIGKDRDVFGDGSVRIVATGAHVIISHERRLRSTARVFSLP